MTDDPTSDARTARAEQLNAGGNVTPADVADLARGLLDIAAQAMPDTFFATDSRCHLARAVLARAADTVPEGECPYPTCKKVHPLDTAGLLAPHANPSRFEGGVCPGTGKAPLRTLAAVTVDEVLRAAHEAAIDHDSPLIGLQQFATWLGVDVVSQSTEDEDARIRAYAQARTGQR